jgi:dethiobiotin synthetase
MNTGRARKKARIVFVTGTDTGVGKTVLTGLLLAHLRRAGCQALAVKPFCSGSRFDARFLSAIQENELPLEEMNPYYFDEPVAPLAAARRQRQRVAIRPLLKRLRSVTERCECLLIEGAGGLLAPLGEGFNALDLIRRLRCEVIVASRNRLGTVNHTLLTIAALRRAGVKQVRVALMSAGAGDASVASNAPLLAELLAPAPLRCLPNLGRGSRTVEGATKNAKKFHKTLALLLE